MKLIFLGAPGAGKGTAADGVAKRYSLATISTGAILREAIKEGTELGLAAQSIINEGKLVPDDIIMNIVKERVKQPDCEKGYILDGVPRTLAQAEMIEELGIEIDNVIMFEIDSKVVIDRLTGRRVCADCGDTYHVKSKPSQKDGTCDRCSGHLIVRKDDEPQTIIDRLNVYEELTAPLVDYYKSKGLLKTVEADDTMENIVKAVSAILEQ